MLTSSDAKFRCLWHMFVWSIMLTLVSQFYIITDHVAFYIFGSMCILVLPFVTSLYSTTAGRRGASLLRVAYVLCDPVLACMAVVPVLLLNRLSPLIHEMECLGEEVKSWNETLKCLGNKSSSDLEILLKNQDVPFDRKPIFWLEKRGFLSGIQASIVMPCILAVLMGRRSRKMDYTTSLLAFGYWLVTALECITTVETTLLFGYSKVHFAVTTQVTVCVASILANSYALVTLCSYLSPMTCKEDRPAAGARFDVIYKCVIGATGVAFVEIPQLVARFQMLASSSDWDNNNSYQHEKSSVSSNFIYSGAITNTSAVLNVLFHNSSNISTDTLSSLDQTHGVEVQTPPASSLLSFDPYNVYKTSPVSFYVWALKDVAMIIVIISLLVLQRFGTGPPILFKILGEGRNCAGAAFDNPNAFFVPEKRDKYIVTHCGKCRNQDFRDGAPKPTSQCAPGDRFMVQDSLDETCFFLPKKSSRKSATAFISSMKPRWSPRKGHVDVIKDTKAFDYSEACRDADDLKQEILPNISNDGADLSKTAYNLVDTATAVTDNDTNSFLAATAAEHSREPAAACFTSNGGKESSSGKDRRQRKTVKFSFSEDLSASRSDEIERSGDNSKQFGRSVSATGSGIPSILVNSNVSRERGDTLLPATATIGRLRDEEGEPETNGRPCG